MLGLHRVEDDYTPEGLPSCTLRKPQTTEGLEFRVQGLEFRVQGLEFRVQGLEFRV